MRRYVCLIIDIEKSKKYSIDNRNQIQFYMDKYIRSLNMLFSKEFQCEVMFSAGDEVQGLFDNVISALLYFRLLEMLMHPVAIRAGIGIGEWTIKMEPRMSTKQDGPAYHNARRAIEEVHDRQLQNIRIYSEEDDDILLNNLINASLVLKQQQIYMQNIVQVLVELIFPFIPKYANVDYYGEVRQLIEIKFEYKLGAKNIKTYSKRNWDKEKFLQFEAIPDIVPIYINGIIDDRESAIIKRNTANIISRILQCSRQNVDSIIRRGNINKIRELDYIALQYVEKIYGGR